MREGEGLGSDPKDQPELPLPEDVEEMAKDADRQREWLHALHLSESKKQMADYLPGGKKWSGALFSGERPAKEEEEP
jgi:hypothetical protein